jgi:hypothetical protein
MVVINASVLANVEALRPIGLQHVHNRIVKCHFITDKRTHGVSIRLYYLVILDMAFLSMA